MKADKFKTTNSVNGGHLHVSVVGENMISNIAIKRNANIEMMIELGRKLKSITPKPCYMQVITMSGVELFKEKYENYGK